MKNLLISAVRRLSGSNKKSLEALSMYEAALEGRMPTEWLDLIIDKGSDEEKFHALRAKLGTSDKPIRPRRPQIERAFRFNGSSLIASNANDATSQPFYLPMRIIDYCIGYFEANPLVVNLSELRAKLITECNYPSLGMSAFPLFLQQYELAERRGHEFRVYSPQTLRSDVLRLLDQIKTPSASFRAENKTPANSLLSV